MKTEKLRNLRPGAFFRFAKNGALYVVGLYEYGRYNYAEKDGRIGVTVYLCENPGLMMMDTFQGFYSGDSAVLVR